MGSALDFQIHGVAMLEEVRIEALIRKGQVRLDIVGEFDHFDLDAFFGGFSASRRGPDLSVGSGGPTLMVVSLAAAEDEDAAF